jgi:hypothetical protein
MDYEVRCACGKPHAVPGADAGASLRCACGRTVEVPPLHELRIAAGEEVFSPAIRVQSLLLAGKLPGTRECVGCFRETNGLVRVSIECERGISLPEGASREPTPPQGCLLGLLAALIPGPAEKEGPLTQHIGQDVAFIVPLPICESCRYELVDPRAVYVALRHIPEYAALLDAYPQFWVTLAE